LAAPPIFSFPQAATRNPQESSRMSQSALTEPDYILDADGIPAELKREPRWIPWRWHHTGTKWTKRPTVKWQTDPTSWREFDEAYSAGYGVAFVLGDGFAGVDLDKCRDECTHEVTPAAQAIVDTLSTYSEMSPSRTGLKSICRGTLPAGHETQGDGIELYTARRIFCLTGERHNQHSVEHRQAELEAIYARYIAPDPQLATLLTVAVTKQENDGSSRLMRVAHKCVEMDLDQSAAVQLIKQYAAILPFPKSYSDGEIGQRLADAGARQQSYPTTDAGNAERFARNNPDTRYCHEWKRWLIWDGTRWADDQTGAMMQRAKTTARSIYDEVAQCTNDDRRQKLAKFAAASESARALEAMVKLAKSELPVTVEQLNRNLWLLNCTNGTVDLRTGQLREHRQSDLITTICPTAYEVGEPTLWLKFLADILSPDLIDFIQRLMGASLVGEVRDEIFPVLFGTGSNGKSVLTATWMGVLGDDLACAAPRDLLQTSRQKQHPTEIALFYGKRLVTVSETEDGCRLSEALVKHLTGRDKLTARWMHGDFWTFEPSHTLVLSTNYKPMVVGTDHAIWRRLRLVPFNVCIAADKQDRELSEKLKAEYPQILAWAVQGCLAWQERGLAAPTDIADATADYKLDSDPFARFVAECLVVDDTAKVSRRDVADAYTRWAAENSEEHFSAKQLVAKMRPLFNSATVKGVNHWRGVRLAV
jgi:P4 family phage/plasmid primase-like protien